MFPVVSGPLDVGLPGSTSVLTKPPPMRITNVNLSGGIPHILGSDLVFPHPHEDCLQNEGNKQKKSKFQTVMGMLNNPRSIHAEIAYRQLRGGPNVSPTYLAQQNGSLRTAQIHNNQEIDYRLPNNGHSRPTGT